MASERRPKGVGRRFAERPRQPARRLIFLQRAAPAG